MTIPSYLSFFFFAAMAASAVGQTDQNLVYGSFFGGSQSDFFTYENGMTTLSSGDWLMAGETNSPDFWVSDDALQPVYDAISGRKGFITRINPTGVPIYSTFFGGTTGFSSFLISSFGEKYCLGGYTGSPDFPVTDGAHNTVFEGDNSGYISCFDSDNSLLWSTFLGSSSFDRVQGVCMAADGVYATGRTGDTELGTDGTFASDFPEGLTGTGSAFVSKFDQNGELLWLSYYHDLYSPFVVEYIEQSYDGSKVYVYAAVLENSIPLSQGAHQEEFGGGDYDVGLSCFSSEDGTLLWSTYFGGEGDEVPGGVVTGAEGSVYISGQTGSANQIATEGAHQEEYSGMDDWFLAKFTSEGGLIWATYFGGSDPEFKPSMSIFDEHLFLTGSSASVSGLTFGSPLESDNESSDLASCVAKFNTADGALIWGTYLGTEEESCLPASRHVPINAGKLAFATTLVSPTCYSYNTEDAIQPAYPGGNFSLWYGILEENTLSVNNAEAALPVRLFPNPASSEVFIELPDVLFAVMDVRVYDLTGRLELNVHGLNQGGALNTSSLGDGMYVLHASAKEKLYTGKLTVTR